MIKLCCKVSFFRPTSPSGKVVLNIGPADIYQEIFDISYRCIISYLHILQLFQSTPSIDANALIYVSINCISKTTAAFCMCERCDIPLQKNYLYYIRSKSKRILQTRTKPPASASHCESWASCCYIYYYILRKKDK